MGSAMAQEACMNWDQIQVSWKQVKGKFVFRRFRAMDDDGRGLGLFSAKMSRDGRSDAQPTAFRPDDRAKRSEFSLHIGC
jgi:hypothetical protein